MERCSVKGGTREMREEKQGEWRSGGRRVDRRKISMSDITACKDVASEIRDEKEDKGETKRKGRGN